MPDPQRHPITPPEELINKWQTERYHQYLSSDDYLHHKIAEWGWQQRNATVPQELKECADQELDALCEWLREARNHGLSYDTGKILANKLRAARRPKPQSLKEQGLQALDLADKGLSESEWQQHSDIIRRALESIKENNQ